VIPQTEDLAGDRAPGQLTLVAMRNGTALTTTSPRRAIPEARPRAARIASIGMAVPAAVVGNAPIADRIGVTDDWIVKRTGIRSRHVAAAGERLSELAAVAGARALELAGIDGGDVDLVLVATTTADELLPNAAPLVANALGARRAGAIDVGAACTGFLSGLALATAQIEAARAEVVLLVGADLMTRITDPDCRHTAALFGDGAGAAVLTAGGDGEGWIGATTLATGPDAGT
jgi:3-oxoacyl-[acyl-carrier-protein] synthase III